MTKKILIAFAILLVLGILWRIVEKFTGKTAGDRPRQGSSAVAVVVHPIRKDTIHDIRTFTGTASPRSQFLVAPKVAGRLEKLLVNIGQEIRNGDPIALLDSQEYGQQVEQARAEMEVAKANVADIQSALDMASRELERVRELRKQQVASESEMDQADAQFRASRAKHEVALAQVKQREAALKAAEVRLSYTRINAAWEDGPSARLIGERFVDEGAMLRANDPIVSVLDLHTMIAAIFIIERDYPNVQVGQAAAITTDAFPGRIFAGTVARKAPLLKETSRQARVEIEVDNPDRLLTPGMFIRAEIRFAARENATLVPAGSIVRRNEQNGVFLADLQVMKVSFVPVTTGITAGDTVEILTPPLEGHVVILGQHLLNDGASILLPDARTDPPAQQAGQPRKGGKRP